MILVQIGEVEKEPHVQRLADGAELLHEDVVEASEMVVLQRLNNGARERDGAGFDRVGLGFGALQESSGKNIERVLGIAAIASL